jgi:hypothetical protein
MVLACSPSVSGRQGPGANPAECGMTPDDLDVYSATVQELLFKDHEDTARAILRERTSIGYPPGMASMKLTEGKEQEVLSSARMETRNDFDEKNKIPCSLDPHIQPAERIQLLSAREERISFPRGSGSWKAFYAKYPGAKGFTLLSRIGFNSTRDQALIYLGNSCELLCGHGYLVLLRKHNGKWKVVKQAEIWIAS